MKQPRTSDSNTPPASETRSTSSNGSYEKSPKRAEIAKETASPLVDVRVVGWVMIVAAYTPLRVYLINADKFPHPERLLLIVAGYTVIGLAFFALLRRLAIGREASLVSSMSLVLLVSSGSALVSSTSTPTAFLISGALVLAIALVTNRLGKGLTSGFSTGILLFILAGLLVGGLSGLADAPGDSFVEESTSSLPANLDSKPDIYVVVLDGFPGPQALDQVYQAALHMPALSHVVRRDAWASYPMTIASVASLFEMGYPLDGGDVVNTNTARSLSAIMAGDNRFTRLLESDEYEITYVESGYSNSYCASVVDTCVASSFLDEGTFWTLNESLFGLGLRRSTGGAFTQGALHTMDWLADNLPSMAENGTADFVFASVLAPHPPLMLDEHCELTYDYWRFGNSVYAGDSILHQRQQAFLDQAQCVADFEADLLSDIPEEAIAILLSDHGGDSLGQMAKDEHVWSESDTIERLNVHFAMKSSLECTLATPVFLSEVLRDLLWCLAGSIENESSTAPRIHTGSRITDTRFYRLDELTPDQVRALSRSG